MIDLRGTRSGRLVVLGFNSRRLKYKDARTKETLPFWDCLCDCGEYTTVEEYKLKAKKTLSCGCYRREMHKLKTSTHGMHTSATYNSWDTMTQRCTNIRNSNYSYYGGRGITICDRWLESFENFLEDMGVRPEGKTLDRIDVDGNYEPSNCRWATYSEQSSNKRKQRNNKTGVTGVCWSKRRSKWLVQFKFGDFKFSKEYDSFDLAVSKRKQLELEYIK